MAPAPPSTGTINRPTIISLTHNKINDLSRCVVSRSAFCACELEPSRVVGLGLERDLMTVWTGPAP